MEKITAAIHKAFDAKEKHYSEDMIELLGLRVTSDFQTKIQDENSVEDISGQRGKRADSGRIFPMLRRHTFCTVSRGKKFAT